MRDGWFLLSLGTFLKQRSERVQPESGTAYMQVTLSINGGGARLRRMVDGAEAVASGQYRVRARDLLVSKIDARKGAAAVVPEALDGAIVTADFPSFEIDTSVVVPEYLDLLVRQPDFAELADSISAGTTNRVRMDLRRFPDLVVALPPLTEQRRIVDLIAAFDAAAEASRREARALRLVHGTLRERMLSEAEATVPLGVVISRIEAGRSPDGVDRQPEAGEASVLKVSAVRPGWFDRTQVKVISDTSVFPEHALVRNGDLLITRANTRELVGAVCLVEGPYPNSFLCDKTLRLVPRTDVASAPYLLEVLQSDDSRRQLSGAATGTSASMKNISQSSIREVRVPLLSAAGQTTLVRIAGSLRDATKRAERLTEAIATSREATLSALLSGHAAIPESYDRLLDGAA